LPDIALPARSVAPESVAVYVLAGAKPVLVDRAAVFVDETYVTVDGTTVLEESRSTKEREDGSTASLNVAETETPTL
jgi:hypothetical protein